LGGGTEPGRPPRAPCNGRDAFNEISLEPSTGRPLNPMINAGAIAASATGTLSIEATAERFLPSNLSNVTMSGNIY
jgi:glutaminase